MGLALLCLAVQMPLASMAVADTYQSVNISDDANWTWSGVETIRGQTGVFVPGAPTGETTLGDVPFNITSNASGYQAWNADIATSLQPGQVSLTMNLDAYGVTNVYTLINSMCGQPGPNSYAWLIFTGSRGATYTKYLVENIDIRDYNNWIYPDQINGTTTVNVYSTMGTIGIGLPCRLDMQDIALPSSFANQTLTSIQLVDNGAPQWQRVVLDGVTLQMGSVPEPSIFALLAAGALGLVGFAWRQRKRPA